MTSQVISKREHGEAASFVIQLYNRHEIEEEKGLHAMVFEAQ